MLTYDYSSDLSNQDFIKYLFIDFLLKAKELFKRVLQLGKIVLLMLAVVLPIIIIAIFLIALVLLPLLYFSVNKDYRKTKKRIQNYSDDFIGANNSEKYSLYSKLEEETDFFYKNQKGISILYDAKILFIHPIIKKIYLTGKIRSELLDKWSKQLYYHLPVTDNIQVLQNQNKLFQSFEEDWNSPDMDIYDLQFGPLSN
ncbi:MAG: hypothetical protein GXO80_03955 [Chlorobi bacterium]|nr:hypothetical protein [Chlorobiota bacterium]